jgi:hypothetical protein
VTTAQGLPAIELHYGRITLTQLTAGTTVRLRVAGTEYVLEATSEGCRLGADFTNGPLTIAVFRGEATVSDHHLNRRVWARADSPRGLSEFRTTAVSDEWPHAGSTAGDIPGALSKAVNDADSAIAAAAEFPDRGAASVSYYVTQVLLQCSVRSDLPVPVEQIRDAAGSPDESRRSSLIAWILGTLQRDRGRNPGLLDQLLEPAGLAVDRKAVIAGWFQAAVASRRPTLQHLTELQAGLRDPGPVLGRQCAKFFLQSILNDPLTEYDPQAPGDRNALISITRKMRAWQQSNLP